jgi:hypothetical protein
MTNESTQNASCQYRELEGEIHEFVMLDSTRASVDEFVEQMEQLQAANDASDATLRVIVDMAISGMPPIRYGFARVGELLRAEDRPPSRTAFILDNQLIATLLEGFGRVFRTERDKVRYFSPDQREQIIAWLLADD